eukprot:2143599-Pleurochrysis_carterae.AAC.1
MQKNPVRFGTTQRASRSEGSACTRRVIWPRGAYTHMHSPRVQHVLGSLALCSQEGSAPKSPTQVHDNAHFNTLGLDVLDAKHELAMLLSAAGASTRYAHHGFRIGATAVCMRARLDARSALVTLLLKADCRNEHVVSFTDYDKSKGGQ